MNIPALRIAACCTAILLALPRPASAETPIAKKPQRATAEKTYAPTDLAALREKVNRRVVIEGKIAATGSSRSGSTSYLNFTKNYRDSVSLVFLGSAITRQFPKDRLATYVGKRVHIGGILEERNGALQIRVLLPEQLRILP